MLMQATLITHTRNKHESGLSVCQEEGLTREGEEARDNKVAT